MSSYPRQRAKKSDIVCHELLFVRRTTLPNVLFVESIITETTQLALRTNLQYSFSLLVEIMLQNRQFIVYISYILIICPDDDLSVTRESCVQRKVNKL